MTREEAIVHIKDIICENNTIKPNIVVFEQEKEALYMAIQALEQEPTTHGYMLVCPNCGLDVHSDFESCPRCGAKMESEEKHDTGI